MKKFINPLKKFVAASTIGLAALVSAHADTLSVTVAGTNYQQVLSAPAIITGYSLTATTNATVGLIDSPTNLPTYSVPGYTNTVSYATNRIVSWTNYFGNVNSWTNIVLVDLSNAVPATTASYPRKATVGALAGTTTTVAPTYMVVDNGLWVTNYSTNTAVLTIQYRQ